MKPDPLALLSLEKEGIDVSFLKAFDPSQEIKEDISVDQIMEQLRPVFELMLRFLLADNNPMLWLASDWVNINLKTYHSIILPELAKLQDKRLLSNRPVEYIDNFELKAAELIQKVLQIKSMLETLKYHFRDFILQSKRLNQLQLLLLNRSARPLASNTKRILF